MFHSRQNGTCANEEREGKECDGNGKKNKKVSLKSVLVSRVCTLFTRTPVPNVAIYGRQQHYYVCIDINTKP